MPAPFIDPRSIIKLVNDVDDACHYLCDILEDMEKNAKARKAQGASQESIDAQYKEMAAIYRMIWPIAGRCKFLRQRNIELLIQLEELNGDRGKASGKPIFKTGYKKPLKQQTKPKESHEQTNQTPPPTPTPKRGRPRKSTK